MVSEAQRDGDAGDMQKYFGQWCLVSTAAGNVNVLT
jgi:hypothetical protein